MVHIDNFSNLEILPFEGVLEMPRNLLAGSPRYWFPASSNCSYKRRRLEAHRFHRTAEPVQQSQTGRKHQNQRKTAIS
jgi:hypothetical protein